MEREGVTEVQGFFFLIFCQQLFFFLIYSGLAQQNCLLSNLLVYVACLHLCGNHPLTAGPYSRHDPGQGQSLRSCGGNFGERVPGAMGSNWLGRAFPHVDGRVALAWKVYIIHKAHQLWGEKAIGPGDRLSTCCKLTDVLL